MSRSRLIVTRWAAAIAAIVLVHLQVVGGPSLIGPVVATYPETAPLAAPGIAWVTVTAGVLQLALVAAWRMSVARAEGDPALLLTGVLLTCITVVSLLSAGALVTLHALAWTPPGPMLILICMTVTGCLAVLLLVRRVRNEQHPYATPAPRLAAG